MIYGIYMFRGPRGVYIHTYNCRIASVGLAQARPNYRNNFTFTKIVNTIPFDYSEWSQLEQPVVEQFTALTGPAARFTTTVKKILNMSRIEAESGSFNP